MILSKLYCRLLKVIVKHVHVKIEYVTIALDESECILVNKL